MGGRPAQPLVVGCSCPQALSCGVRVCFSRGQAKPGLTGGAHHLEAESYIKPIKGLWALQPGSCLAARDGGRDGAGASGALTHRPGAQRG